jgi:hypothetical protein
MKVRDTNSKGREKLSRKSSYSTAVTQREAPICGVLCSVFRYTTCHTVPFSTRFITLHETPLGKTATPGVIRGGFQRHFLPGLPLPRCEQCSFCPEVDRLKAFRARMKVAFTPLLLMHSRSQPRSQIHQCMSIKSVTKLLHPRTFYSSNTVPRPNKRKNTFFYVALRGDPNAGWRPLKHR